MDFNGILIYGNSYLAQGTKRMTYDEIVTVSERSERGSLIRLYPHLSFSLIFNAQRTTHNEFVTAKPAESGLWQSNPLQPALFNVIRYTIYVIPL